MKRKSSVIIFDFDGTIADSFPIALDIFYALTRTRVFSNRRLARLKGMNLLQVAKELRVPVYAVPLLVMRGRYTMRRRMKEVPLIAGMEQLIRELAKDHTLFILSSNSVHNINIVLHRYGLEDCFEAVYGNARLLGKAKKIRKIVRRYGLVAAEAWYVGDEIRDVEAGRAAGLKVAAVTWGYNSREALKASQPTRLVDSGRDLKRCF